MPSFTGKTATQHIEMGTQRRGEDSDPCHANGYKIFRLATKLATCKDAREPLAPYNYMERE